MSNLIRLLSSGRINEKTEENIKEKLLLKYNEDFSIYKIGRRYGTINNETVTAYCKDKDGIIFSSILNVDKVHFYDNYCLRLLCNELETKIEKELDDKKIISYPKITIIGLNVLDEKITLKEFIKKYKGACFLVNLYLNNKVTKKTLKEVFNKIETEYKNIDIRGNIIVINKNKYDEYIEKFKGIDHTDNYYVKDEDIVDKCRIEVV